MQFSQFLVAATSLFALASASPVVIPKDVSPVHQLLSRDAASIRASLAVIEAKTIILRDYFAAATGTPEEVDQIRLLNTDLLSAVAAAKATAAASNVLTLTEVLGTAPTITRLQATLDDGLATIKSRKPLTVQLGFRVEVHDTLVIDRDAVNDYGATLLTKVPASGQTLAQGYLAAIQASFQDAITFYETD